MGEVFHSGEREIQQSLGELDKANSNGRIIKDSIVKGAVNFIKKQPMVLVSSTNNEGQVWTSLLIGDPGFTEIPNTRVLVFDQNKIRSFRGDIFYHNIRENPEFGSLFIDLTKRIRYRVNGNVSRYGNKIEVRIHEAYANCPKYIQRRVVSLPEHFKETISTTVHGRQLGASEKDQILGADTLFVGSRSNEGRMDASHRGGNPGFIELLDDYTLKIPDYQGNSIYNTFGNFVQDPNTGILFIDFTKGQTLQLTGKAELLFDQITEQDIEKTTGTGRYWLFKTEQWIRTENHHEAIWELIDYSQFNP